MTNVPFTGVGGFQGRQLAVGVVRGLRAFAVAPGGWLTGATFLQRWEPGPNTAVCLRGLTVSQALPTKIAGREWPTPEDDDHDFAGCSCGYWSYYGRRSVEKVGMGVAVNAQQIVLGVIEGYYRVYAGDQGFRASRAVLVAVTLPPDRDEVVMPWQYQDCDRSFLPWGASWGMPMKTVQVDEIRDRYASLPVFPTADSMLAEFPPDGSVIGKGEVAA